MKSLRKIGIILWLCLITGPLQAQIPIALIIKETIQKAVVAMDLKVQKLQTRTIWLQNTQKALENALSQIQLNQIASWINAQKNVYQEYFDELWKVKSVISYDHRVREISHQAYSIAMEYATTWNEILNDPHFSNGERDYMEGVYTGILSQSTESLKRLEGIVKPYSSQMTDAQRLEEINLLSRSMQKNLDDLEEFSQQNMRISLERSTDQNDLNLITKLYGLP